MADEGETSFKLLGTVSAILAGVVAKKVLTSGWQFATGHQPPANPEDPDVTLTEAVAYAIVSGALIGVARMLAARQAAEYYKRSTGHLPDSAQSVS